MTRNQARYQAQRAARAEYNARMMDPTGPGRLSDREDSGQSSAKLAYSHKMREWGYAERSVE